MNRVLVYLIVLVIGLPVFAANDLVVIPPKLTADQIRAYNLEQLDKLIDELSLSWKDLNALINRKDNSRLEPGIAALVALRKFVGVDENIETVMGALRREVSKLDKGTVSLKVIQHSLITLGQITCQSPSRYMEELVDLRDEAFKRMEGNAQQDPIASLFQLAIQAIEKRDMKPVNLMEMIDKLEGGESGAVRRLQRMEDFLRQYVIGQPEVIERIINIEYRDRLFAKAKETPNVMWLMGLPGTGKDTIARAWANAKHGVKGAYRRHMFSLPIMRNHSDLWKVLGSATGYLGSEKTPGFLDFLVQHSNGRYKWEQVAGHNGVTYKVVENSEYRGKTLPGYFPPEEGVIFANEFHNWSRQIKDEFLKQALEHGYYSINNPNGGLTEIYVPVQILIASNDGIGTITAREANGQRRGKALSYEQIQKKWDEVSINKDALISSVLAGNGEVNDPTPRADAPGTSEEFINRVPKQNLLLLRAIAPDDLKRIAEMALEEAAESLDGETDFFKAIKLKWDKGVVDFVQAYDYNAEENARPVKDRVESLVLEPLTEAVRKGQIEAKKQVINVELDVKRNEDGTSSVILAVTEATGKQSLIERVIPETLKDRIRPELSDERIDELLQFAETAEKGVFGVEDVVKRIQNRILKISNSLTAGAVAAPLNVLGVFGLTSTGKTELAKKVAKGVLGSEEDLVVFDFSQIQTMHDFQARILGLKDSRGNPIASDFMKAYDRSGGTLVIALDEIANVRDPELLKSLYDFFREPVVTTFSDGKARPMGGVFAIVTGNAGQELFAAVPNDIPDAVRMTAWKQIADKLQNDSNLQMSVLEKYLPWPLIARIGKNNIFFVSPHNYRSLRQLAQLKLGNSLTNLSNTNGRRGWNIVFPDPAEYAKFVDTIIEEGFNLKTQGASIEQFVRQDFETEIESALIAAKVPSKSVVVMRERAKTANNDEEEAGFIIYDLEVQGGKTVEFKIQRPHNHDQIKTHVPNQLLTAFHEAGHSLVRQALFKDIFKPIKISIIPGVSQIAGEWVYYAGVAVNEMQRDVNQSRDYLVRLIAVLTAGEISERMVSKGEVHSMGKSNDMKRASTMAREAILKYGLSEKWGTAAVPAGVELQDYVLGLSDARRRLLEQEEKALIDEGWKLAQETLEANFNNGLIPLGNLLAVKGVVKAKELETFYSENPMLAAHEVSLPTRMANQLRTFWRGLTSRAPKSPDTLIYDWIPLPEKVADIEAIAEQEKRDLYATVPLPDSLPVLNSNQATPPPAEASSCDDALTGKAS